MAKPDFDDSVLGDNTEIDTDSGLVGYVQENAGSGGSLTASGADGDTLDDSRDDD